MRGFVIFRPPELHLFTLNIKNPAQNNMDTKRQIVIEMVSRGMTVTEISKAVGMSRKSIYGIKKRFEERGTVERKKGQGRKRSVRTKAIVKAVKGRVQRNPVRTIRGMANQHCPQDRS